MLASILYFCRREVPLVSKHVAATVNQQLKMNKYVCCLVNWITCQQHNVHFLQHICTIPWLILKPSLKSSQTSVLCTSKSFWKVFWRLCQQQFTSSLFLQIRKLYCKTLEEEFRAAPPKVLAK